MRSSRFLSSLEISGALSVFYYEAAGFAGVEVGLAAVVDFPPVGATLPLPFLLLDALANIAIITGSISSLAPIDVSS